jgi:hypothetical protein
MQDGRPREMPKKDQWRIEREKNDKLKERKEESDVNDC